LRNRAIILAAITRFDLAHRVDITSAEVRAVVMEVPYNVTTVARHIRGAGYTITLEKRGPRGPHVASGVVPELLAYIERHWPCAAIPYGASAELATRFGISRQRVQQLLSRRDITIATYASTRETYICTCGQPLASKPRESRLRAFYCRHSPLVTLACDTCGVLFTRLPSQVLRRAASEGYKGSQFCSRACFYSGPSVGGKGVPRPNKRKPVPGTQGGTP